MRHDWADRPVFARLTWPMSFDQRVGTVGREGVFVAQPGLVFIVFALVKSSEVSSPIFTSTAHRPLMLQYSHHPAAFYSTYVPGIVDKMQQCSAKGFASSRLKRSL